MPYSAAAYIDLWRFWAEYNGYGSCKSDDTTEYVSHM